jgi:hypothetical protein
LEVAVSHFPPATSKWNKIEHRLFGLELGRRAKRVHGRLYVEGVKGLLACFRRERLISFGGCYDSHFYGEADRARKVSRPMNHYEELAKAEPGCLCRVGRVVTRS